MSAPFFLVGAERSGTTLLRLMLSHHPEIECAPEFEFLVEPLTEAGAWPDVGAYTDWLETERTFLPHELPIDRTVDYASLARGFFERFHERAGKPVRGATCHRHFDRLLRLWPEARFLHLVRDGRDVARSCIGMGWAGNVWTAARRWIDAEMLWRELAARVPAERRLDVRYEDLVSTPSDELARVCAFLERAFDARMLDYARTSTYDAPDPSLAERWRRDLGPRELALLEARIGPMLRERGYAPSGVAAAPPGPLGRLRLAIQDRVFRFRFRWRRYGLGSIVKGRLAALLGWKGLGRRVIVERNRVDDRHLR